MTPNEEYVFWKLALARTEAVLIEEGAPPAFVKLAIFEGEKALKRFSGGFDPKGMSANVRNALARIKQQMIHGTYSTKGTISPGVFATKKQMKNWSRYKSRSALAKKIRSTRAAGKGLSRAEKLKKITKIYKSHKKLPKPSPGILKRLGTSGARGLNRLFAAGSIYGVGSAALSKRKKGEGFFQSMGRRTGQAASALSFYLPGKAGVAAGGYMMGELAGLPSLGRVGAGVGRAADVGVKKVRALGGGVRKMFGGGKSFKKKKLLAMTKRPKAKLDEENRFNLKAGYQ